MVCDSPPSALSSAGRPFALLALGKDVAPLGIGQRHMEMHAGAGIFLDRLGHEAGGDAVPAGGGAHQPLQHDEIVGGPQHILAVVERQLVLAGRIFGDHRLGGNALQRGRGVDVGKQRLHAVQMVDRIDLGLAALAAVEHGRGRLHAALGVALIGKQEELQLEGAGRLSGPFRQAPRPAGPAHDAGRRSSAVRRDGTSTSAAGRAAAACHTAAPACRVSANRAGRRRRNPRSARSRGHPRR